MNRIKEIIKEKGMSMNELADTLGITRQTLSSQINGTANIASYEKIAKALGVSMGELFDAPAQNNTSVTCPKCGAKLTVKVEE